MKNCSYLPALPLIIILLINIQIFAQPTPPQGFEWKVVPELTDEFDIWDTSKWYKSLWNYGVPVQMTTENSGVSDGKLWIQATLDSTSTRWFHTSRIWSTNEISFPMYTECSMKTAHISAYNTFWMNNGDINNRDEIDICENNSNPSIPSYTTWPYLMQSQYFLTVGGNDERAKGNFDNRDLSDNNPLQGVPWNEDYHTLGVWWKDKNNVQFYLDGEPAGSVTTTRDFTRSLSIIWDLWTIDANWSGGITNKTDLLNDSINTMYVDWIHTYALESDGSVSISDYEEVSANIEIFPNPATNWLKVQLLDPIKENASLQIHNHIGQLVKSQKLGKETTQISLSSFPNGIYTVSVSNGENKSFQKMVKQ